MSLKIMRSTIFAGAVVGLAAPAMAHHSFGEFEMNKPLSLSGTLKEMHLVNPHSYMEIEVTDAATGRPGASERGGLRAAFTGSP